MSLALTNLSWWWLKGKQKEPKLQNGASLNNPATELSLWESETLKFSLSFGGKNRSSKPRRVKRKLQEQRIDREHDVVIVPSDGGCISDSDSDASDWSIGWSEPHAPGFLSDEESDGGFGVLVPCYGSKNRDAGEGMRGFGDSKVNAAADRISADSKRRNHPTFPAIDQFVGAENTNYEQVSAFRAMFEV